jgi:Rod binding domain-containing protein
MNLSSLNLPKTKPFEATAYSAAQGKHAKGAEVARLSFDTKPGAPSQDEKIETQVKNWVGQTFFGTLLKQMRDSPFKSELFGGGRGEQAFGSIYDTHLAQRMAQGLGERIARPIVKKFQRQAAAAYEKNSKQTLTQKEQYRAND